LNKYRRIEVKAFRRRVTIVSGEWPREASDVSAPQVSDEVSLNDTDVSEPVEPDSPEGQLILVEAVRSLERRLSPEARAMIRYSSGHSHAEPKEFNSAKEEGIGS
jgi:hypothetical protein